VKFVDLIEALAAEELAATLADLAEQAPEPVPEIMIATVDEAQQIAHELYPGRGEATAWLVDTAGISDRSARRWLQTGECPPGREARLITTVEAEANRRIREANADAAAAHAAAVAAANAAPKGQRAAARLGAIGPTGASVGDVDVMYGDSDDGDRFVGDVDIDWADILTALEQDDLEAAEEEFSRAVLDSYDPGLGDTLTAADYGHIDLR
jgi:hypothetical protein